MASVSAYRKRPVEIEAIQWNPYAEATVNAVRDWLESHGKSLSHFPNVATIWVNVEGGLNIQTLEGVMTAQAGDWVIRGVAGEFYPCKPDIFEATYEPVGEQPNPDQLAFDLDL